MTSSISNSPESASTQSSQHNTVIAGTINEILYKSRESFTNFTEISQAIEQRSNLTPQEKSWLLKFLYEKEELDNLTLQKGEKHYCSLCNHFHYSTIYCDNCMKELLRNGFEEWTSGVPLIDKFIQRCQMEKPIPRFIVEWIPFEDFTLVQYKTRGGFGEIYTAIWQRGRIVGWDKDRGAFIRQPNIAVALKNLFKDPDEDFFKEAETCLSMKGDTRFIVECYGLSRNPTTGNLIIVMAYMEQGDLRNYLHDNADKLTWKDKFMIISQISNGLSRIHQKGLVHGDLHSGNILRSNLGTNRITDLGFRGPPQKTYSKLMRSCWHPDKDQRPSASEVKEFADSALKKIYDESSLTSPEEKISVMTPSIKSERPPQNPSSFLFSQMLDTRSMNLQYESWKSSLAIKPEESIGSTAQNSLPLLSSTQSRKSNEFLTSNMVPTPSPLLIPRATSSSPFVSSPTTSPTTSLPPNSYVPRGRATKLLPFKNTFDDSDDDTNDKDAVAVNSSSNLKDKATAAIDVAAAIAAASEAMSSNLGENVGEKSLSEDGEEKSLVECIEEKSLPVPTIEQKRQQLTSHSLNSTDSSNLNDSKQTSDSQNESKSIVLQSSNSLKEENNSSVEPNNQSKNPSSPPPPIDTKTVKNSSKNVMHKLDPELSEKIPVISSPRISPTNAAPTIDNRRRGSLNALPQNTYDHSVGTQNENLRINTDCYLTNATPAYPLLPSPATSQDNSRRNSFSSQPLSHHGSADSLDSPQFGPPLPRMYKPPPNNYNNNWSRHASVVSNPTTQSIPSSQSSPFLKTSKPMSLQQFVLDEADLNEIEISNDPAEEMNKLIKELDKARPKPPKQSWKAKDVENSEYEYKPPSPDTNNEVIESNASYTNFHEPFQNTNLSQSLANTNFNGQNIEPQTLQQQQQFAPQHYRNPLSMANPGTIMIPQNPTSPQQPFSSPPTSLQFNPQPQFQQPKRTSAPAIITPNAVNPGTVPHSPMHASMMMYHQYRGMPMDFRMQQPLEIVNEQLQSSASSIISTHTDPGELSDNATVGRTRSGSDKSVKSGLRAKFGTIWKKKKE
ncbi:8165_t:CDS:2 [Ambispora leptoticha]|uniref:8165_t:CDS:1 n=1 Tax=Ambispora leptoticha TaxID=144679 RepID=A0A9N9B502_9GLOM|nr:8165_t:CDS:2 [Ambispora leptoticha]